MVSKHVGYKNYQQLLDLSPIFIASGISLIFGYLFGNLLELSFYVDALVKVVIFTIVYLSWSVIFKLESYTYTLSIVKMFTSKKKNKQL